MRTTRHRCRSRRGHHGREHGPRVHVPDSRRRGHHTYLRALRVHREPPGGEVPQTYPPSRGAETDREGRHTWHRHHRDAGPSLEIPKSRTAKAVFQVAAIEGAERFVFAVVRGDMELNETKLANAVGASELRPALPEEVRAVGAEPGYGSPLGVEGTIVVVDDAIPVSPNLVAGANEEGFHFLNVNYGRDFEAEIVADIAAAGDGSLCPECGDAMRAVRGVEVGNIFKLGTRYSEAFGASFLNEDGRRKPVVMGSYGIGLGRLLACIAEEHHDENGLIWPVSVAPYHVHIVAAEVGEMADGLYERLISAGVEVLYDDRRESLGVKFKDADLIGAPIRLTLTPRSLQRGGVEIKARSDAEGSIVSTDEVVSVVKGKIADLETEVSLGDSIAPAPRESPA